MKPLCPKCFSSQVVPMTTANPNFPQSLEPSLLSPAVIASVGVAICRQLGVPPLYGMVIGTIVGIALSNFANKQIACTSYYCRSCQQCFETDNTCQYPFVQSHTTQSI